MAAVRPLDTVRVEVIGSGTVAGGQLDNFTSLLIRNDITMPSEASFEVGDDGTWRSLGNIFEPGVEFQVFVNNTPRLRGRVEMNDVPFDPRAGAVVRFTVRTKLSDAMFASADQRTRVRGVSIKDFILALYKPLGYTEADFVFDQSVSRNLLTGKSRQQGETPKDLEPIKPDEARVKPPESIYAAADRHLRRHGLMHWDDPTGKIVVGAPNDEQEPTFTFNMFRDPGAAGNKVNNVLGATRTRDWSGVPAIVGVFGRGGKRDFTKARVAGFAEARDVSDAGFFRPVTIIAEGIRSRDLADRAAARELAARSKRKDAFAIDVDGFSWWDGQGQTIYAPDTVADVNTDVAGGNAGAFYLHAVTLMRDATNGDTASLELVKRGIWRL